MMRLPPALIPLVYSLLFFLVGMPSWAQANNSLLVSTDAASASSLASPSAPLNLYIQLGPLSMGQTSTQKTSTPGDSYPADASFSQTPFNGPVGLISSLGGWWKLTNSMSLGVATKIRWSTYKLRIDDKILSDTSSNAMALGTFMYKLNGNFNVEAGFGYHKIDGVFFRYTEGKASAELLNMSTHGLRANGALSGNFSDLYFRVDVGETFGPAPAATEISVEANYKLPAPISSFFPVFVGVQYQFAYRDLSAQTTGTEISVSGTENLLALTIGASFGLFGQSNQSPSVPEVEPIEELPPAEDGSLDL